MTNLYGTLLKSYSGLSGKKKKKVLLKREVLVFPIAVFWDLYKQISQKFNFRDKLEKMWTWGLAIYLKHWPKSLQLNAL